MRAAAVALALCCHLCLVQASCVAVRHDHLPLTAHGSTPPTHTPPACRDGKHVVFGQVVEGLDVVKKVESYGSQSGKTSQTLTVTDCGQLA